MAISNSDGSIVLTTKVDQSGLKKGMTSISGFAKSAGKALLAVGAAAATATVAITKMAVSAYADYEQLVGGVETLFKGSADKVMKYAENAFATAGISANEYMKQVTSFSASLISSTAGDTEKAADIADMALTDMADNANKMGTPLENIQNAYQGFAKQQYMLLDNLKLGYGGTKTEMERLLKDAEALTGQKYDISNLGDVYNAIHAIQTELGITGTTAKEAEETISGSAAMMKASWQNVLTAISGGGDLDRAINNLVYSIQTYFKNIVPVVERALQGIGQLIEQVAPMLVQTVARSLIKAIPSLLNAVYQMILGLAKGIYQGIVDLFSGATDTVEKQTNQIQSSVDSQNKLTQAVEKTEEAQKGALAGFDEINTLTTSTAENQEVDAGITINETSGTSALIGDTEKAESVFGGFIQRVIKLLEPLTTSLGKLFEPMKESAYKVKRELEPFAEWISVKFAPTLVNGLAKGIDSVRISFETISEPIERLWNDTLKPIIGDVGQWVLDIINSTSSSFDYFSEKMVEYEDEITAVIDGISFILQVIWSILKPILSSVVGGIGNVLKTTIDFIFSIIRVLGNFFSHFGNIFNAIKALFEGNTDDAVKYAKKALANLVNIFVGIANAIISVINNLWSLIFDAFKGTVNSIGGLVSKIGSFFGADWDLSFDAKAPLIPLIPKYVPKLATGTVVPPNREFLAVLGDNKRETEVVSPLSTIKQAVAEVMANMNILAPQDNRPIVLQIDGKEIARATRSGEQQLGKQTVFGGFANAY